MFLTVTVRAKHLTFIYFGENLGPRLVSQIANRQFKFFCRRVEVMKVEDVTFKDFSTFFAAVVAFLTNCIFKTASKYSSALR